MQSCTPALLIIDMQKSMHTAVAGRRNNLGAEESIARLLNAWRQAKATVVHVRHISRTPGSLFWPGQAGVEFQEEFKPLDIEHVVEKNVPCALTNSGLERWLRVRGISAVVVVGVSTNNSVEATVRTAGNVGLRTMVVSDATFAFDKRSYEGAHRTAEEVHAMSLANLDGEYAQVLSTEQALREL